MTPLASRLWILPHAPADLADCAPPGYGPGCCALAYGGPSDGTPPAAWLAGLPAALGLTPEAAATLCVRPAGSFLWAAYWHPQGAVEPSLPAVPAWPPADPEPS